MSTPIVATKLYIPQPRPNAILRPRLVARLNEGLHCKLTLISAAAGFGKTTLVSSWLHHLQAEATSQANIVYHIAWLSLDNGDNDPTRFLLHLVAALQTTAAHVGAGVLAALQSPQPPPAEAILTALLNQLTSIPDKSILVLDDYHVIEAALVDQALGFLVEHLPPQIHLVIATRENPPLPLARLRARGHLTELRAAELRFTPAEAAEFLNQTMGLNLSAAAIAALDTRTEGWIAGLQLAAISMRGHADAASFITSFTGSHHFVLDYLLEEVLHQQPQPIQTFLLRTSILERMCGPLCEAVLHPPAPSGQTTLEYLEHANLFIVPLDNERRWYRYHHLFAELLRQRLHQAAASTGDAGGSIAELHIRASIWYEEHGLEIEAFQHAASANDVERAERLMAGKGIPLHLRGAATPLLEWLESLPIPVLNARPSLWWKHASLLLVIGQTTSVEAKLQAAEAAIAAAAPHGVEPDDKTRNLVGQIAAARATLALTQYRAAAIIVQARRALVYLHPDNLSYRSVAFWAMGFAYYLQGDRAAASQAYTEAIALSQASGDIFTTITATTGLGNVQEVQNQLTTAHETYQNVLKLVGDPPLPSASDAYLGLARICYEWNDLEAAEHYGQQSLHLARQYERVIDRFIISEVFLARLKLARGDLDGASALLAQADQSARQRNFVHRTPEIAAAQVLALLRQGNLAAAAHLAQTHTLPISQARVLLAQGEPTAALE
ncbi:MAG: LuxR family transcriptional regulator, partial [Roseiflexaceae bacterium]|nr:LuxR family transcriptional regulator [Roseiflexaceae bacterium]